MGRGGASQSGILHLETQTVPGLSSSPTGHGTGQARAREAFTDTKSSIKLLPDTQNEVKL